MLWLDLVPGVLSSLRSCYGYVRYYATLLHRAPNEFNFLFYLKVIDVCSVYIALLFARLYYCTFIIQTERTKKKNG